MNKIKLICLGICLTVFPRIFSQTKNVENYANVWLSNLNKYHLNNSFYVNSELHIRRVNGIKNWQQFLFRPAINYQFNNTLTGAIGYTYILSYPYGSQSAGIVIPEHNIWEQVSLSHKQANHKFSHRYRLEHRWIGKTTVNSDGSTSINGTRYAQRFRYRLTGSFPITKNGKFFGKYFDEVWINLADNFMPESLNQNWLYLGMGYKFSPIGKIELGYMNQFLSYGNLVQYESNHTLQATISFDFFKE